MDRDERGPDDEMTAKAPEFDERVVQINRVAKVVKGGRRFCFGSLVVVGDGKGRVGVGLGKAGEVPDSIRKGVEAAKKILITVPLDGTTIPHQVEEKLRRLDRADEAGRPGNRRYRRWWSACRARGCRCQDVLTKAHGSNNPVNVVRATIKALEALESLDAVARRRTRRTSTARLRKPISRDGPRPVQVPERRPSARLRGGGPSGVAAARQAEAEGMTTCEAAESAAPSRSRLMRSTIGRPAESGIAPLGLVWVSRRTSRHRFGRGAIARTSLWFGA